MVFTACGVLRVWSSRTEIMRFLFGSNTLLAYVLSTVCVVCGVGFCARWVAHSRTTQRLSQSLMSKTSGHLPDLLPNPLEYILDPKSRPAIRTVDRISLRRKMHGCTAVCTTNFLNDHSTFLHVVPQKTK